MAPQPLKIIIAGAGIGGLTAGLALRQNGHHVTIVESSRFSNETGAAIHIAPNATGLLERLGVFIEEHGANECTGIRIYTPGGHQVMAANLTEDNKKWQHSWHLVHRGHLHLALWTKAVSKKGPGRPCELLLAKRVKSVDPHKAEVLLESGEVLTGDVVLGADGVHSRARQALDLEKCPAPYDGGHSAFRFLIPKQDLLDDPETREIVGWPGLLNMAIGEDRRLVYYDCVNHTLMNCLLIHPSAESRSDDQDWNQRGDKTRMLEIGSTFAPQFQKLMAKASEDSLKVWTLLDLEVLPKWTNDKLALLGDAAHPFLPHQAQGGAQAIEDALSLAAVLPLGTPIADIPERLQLYQTCRKERADTIQDFTRLAGKSFKEQQESGRKYDPARFSAYNYSHDEWHHSTHALKKHLWAKENHRWRQPLAFGPSPGPRQPLNQLPDVLSTAQQYQIVHSIRFNTSATVLKNLFPSRSFSFRDPHTIVQASVVCCSLKNMAWLGGTGYNHCGLYIHGVQYTKQDGEVLHGTYLPVLFEDLADPIITGREEIAAPKWGCDIDIQDHAGVSKSKSIKLSWRGTVFGELDFGDLSTEPHALATEQHAEGINGISPAEAPASAAATQAPPTNGVSSTETSTPSQPAPPSSIAPKTTPDDGMFLYRYIPVVGEPGKADAEYAVFEPYDTTAATTTPAPTSDSTFQPQSEKLVSKNASIRFTAGDWQTLPTLQHIAEVLAAVPVYGILEAKVERVGRVGDVRGARRIE